MEKVPDFPFAYLNGPYLDVKTYGSPVCSMNVFMMINQTFAGQLILIFLYILLNLILINFKGIIQLEMKQLYFDEITESRKFMSLDFIFIKSSQLPENWIWNTF